MDGEWLKATSSVPINGYSTASVHAKDERRTAKGSGKQKLNMLNPTPTAQVWRATFVPHEGVHLRLLDVDEVADVERDDKVERVGLLPRWYWEEIKGEEETRQEVQPPVVRKVVKKVTRTREVRPAPDALENDDELVRPTFSEQRNGGRATADGRVRYRQPDGPEAGPLEWQA
jgi:hypothetical protein